MTPTVWYAIGLSQGLANSQHGQDSDIGPTGVVVLAILFAALVVFAIWGFICIGRMYK